MKNAKDLIPWTVRDISIRPYDGYWSFNPSIHFDGETWRCVLRCCDYAMPDGQTIRSQNARVAGQMTKNAMVIFDPATWKPIKIFKMHEKDEYPRVACPHYGYEDMRLFRTDKGGLQGIAASLHLRRGEAPVGAAIGTGLPSSHQPPEQVVVSFDDEYHIIGAAPIRGERWSGTPQKNWVPYDHCAEPRFLYSIDKGSMFDETGSVHGSDAAARPSQQGPRTASTTVLPEIRQPAVEAGEVAVAAAVDTTPVQTSAPEPEKPRDRSRRHPPVRGGDVRIIRGGRVKIDAMASRPSVRPKAKPGKPSTAAARHSDESTRMMGSGRVLLPKYEGLRGGSQLVRVGEDAWLGIAHEMKFVSGKKWYWHTWYLVDSRGRMTAASDAMKLAPNGIEFAAGLAIDGERAIVSFGVDDMECWIGETQLSAVMEILRPIER